MAAITAQLVKELRDKSGAGMMDSKAALIENDGDMDAAIDWLRAKGLSKAAKKAGRVAAEGLVGVALGDKAGAVVEVNSETDFVARNEKFQQMVDEVVKLALDAKGDFDALTKTQMSSGKPVSEHITEMVGTIGENMSLRRSASISVSDGVVVSYTHNSVAPNLGKIGVLVALESTGDEAKLKELGRQVAMHVAATNPLALNENEIDAATVERERAILIEQAKESGKPDNVIEQIVDGRLLKFFKESVLLKQQFVVDPDNTVEKAVKAAEDGVGGAITIKGFIRFELGEGIEKEESDFAAEVAAAAGG
ncbi:MAG: translation elongation factor Ts [Hyphomicrobiales bacterium]|nr:translation elongation factor Ts [Hyphomicrobiales bacterium]